MLDVSDWTKVRKGTGSRPGYWVQDRESRWYLLKFPKEQATQEGLFVTGEVGAEVLASHVGRWLGLPVPIVEPAIMNRRVGALVRSFLGPGQELREGIDLAGSMSKDRLTVARVLECLGHYTDRHLAVRGFIRMVCFDILTGNADRHQANWGVTLGNGGSAEMAPYYDNAAAFGSALDPLRIELHLRKGLGRFDRQFRYEILLREDARKPGIPELLATVRQLDPDMAGFKELVGNLTDDAIDQILASIDEPESIMEPERWSFARVVLRSRRDILVARGDG